MPSEFVISDEIKTLINKIIAKNNLNDVSDIKYESGSEIGDGYISRTVAVDIMNRKSPFKVFLKCALNLKSSDALPIDKLYKTEIYFYDIVYPVLSKFLERHNAKNALNFIPKCYATGSETLIALENLREKNFTLFDKTKFMNEAHITMVLKTFAKFHAICYAFKDQEKAKYDKITENTYDFYSTAGESFRPSMEKTINEFITEKLDPEKDKCILEKCDDLTNKLVSALTSARRNVNQYSILSQGDSHCVNMMFTYENENPQNPSDIRLVDWQLLRVASPVYDIAYFIYPIASEETLDKLNDYLKIYHEELSKWIRLLGSDPDIMYPLDVFLKEWKEFCLYGLASSINVIRALLSAKEEVVNIEDINFADPDYSNKFELPKLKKEAEYDERVKSILAHMVKNNILK